MKKSTVYLNQPKISSNNCNCRLPLLVCNFTSICFIQMKHQKPNKQRHQNSTIFLIIQETEEKSRSIHSISLEILKNHLKRQQFYYNLFHTNEPMETRVITSGNKQIHQNSTTFLIIYLGRYFAEKLKKNQKCVVLHYRRSCLREKIELETL